MSAGNLAAAPFGASAFSTEARSLSGLLMSIVSSAGIFVAMAGICLDRLLKQRSALQNPDFSFDFPPPRGGLRSLSVGADCLATDSRALSELLS
jgi:hypothetical protein